MLRQTHITLGFVNGGFAPGSKHQKHMFYCPTKFLYRFAGKRGPGPILMKYWHTNGTMPTGLEIPIHLEGFRQHYIREHLPMEVEDWLNCVVVDPVNAVTSNLDMFLDELNFSTRATSSSSSPSKLMMLSSGVSSSSTPSPFLQSAFAPRKAVVPQKVMEPLRAAFDEFGVDIPGTALRGVMSQQRLRERTQYLVGEYSEFVKEHASTPHRRWAGQPAREQLQETARIQLDAGDDGDRVQLKMPLASSSSLARFPPIDKESASSGDAGTPLSEGGTTILRDAIAVPDETSEDEALLICTLTTLAQGAAVMKRPDHAVALLENALRFAHDDTTASSIHGNLASALNANGQYREASNHAQESVVLGDSAKGYANWAIAAAYMEKSDEALRIIDDGLKVFPDSAILRTTYKNIAKEVGGKTTTPVESQGRRYHSLMETWKALDEKKGVMFANEFDFVTMFNGKRVPFKIDPTSAGLGSDFRRVTVQSFGHTSSAAGESA